MLIFFLQEAVLQTPTLGNNNQLTMVFKNLIGIIDPTSKCLLTKLSRFVQDPYLFFIGANGSIRPFFRKKIMDFSASGQWNIPAAVVVPPSTTVNTPTPVSFIQSF